MADSILDKGIWADDLLGRRKEADLIIEYIRGSLPPSGEGAIKLAIDAAYGEGKTFFLKRLANELSNNHPVAYVDAWVDDLADEPLTALIATLQEALEPIFLNKKIGVEVKSKFDVALEKSGKIAKIASLGLFKRGLSLLITEGAVNATSGIIGDDGGALKDAVRSQFDSAGADSVAALKAAVSESSDLMSRRVSEFQSGREAINELKTSLADLAGSLKGSDLKSPIIIIIDELDRCRPTYAIKLLEEIKHLFDVSGFVFIFGIHNDALAHSVKATYGATFDGQSYLKRFVDRRYRLARPSLEQVIAERMHGSKISNKIQYDAVAESSYSSMPIRLEELISKYCGLYGLGARDALELIDILETSVALTQGKLLKAAFLIPLAIGQIRGLPEGALPEVVNESNWVFEVYQANQGVENTKNYSPDNIANKYLQASKLTWDQISRSRNSTKFEREAMHSMSGNTEEVISAICSYPRLLSMVAKIERVEQ